MTRRSIRNPFYSNALRRQFEAGVKAWEDKGPLLFTASGNRNTGNSWAAQFWRGYDGVNVNKWDAASKATFGYAIWRAGRSVRAREDKAARDG